MNAGGGPAGTAWWRTSGARATSALAVILLGVLSPARRSSGNDGAVSACRGVRARTRSALAELDPVEHVAVLEELLRHHPELRVEAERIAREQLMNVDQDHVAEEVESELHSLCSDELNGRAGRQRGGYVEPTEAAWELLGEAIEAFDREVERLIALGMTGPAVDTALGVIAGLHRCDGCEDGELLLSWAPDFPLAHASGIVDQLARDGIELTPELLTAAAPAWATSLTRARRAHA
jgi:hypothetical protein